jgi:hypothetical protein
VTRARGESIADENRETVEVGARHHIGVEAAVADTEVLGVEVAGAGRTVAVDLRGEIPEEVLARGKRLQRGRNTSERSGQSRPSNAVA